MKNITSIIIIAISMQSCIPLAAGYIAGSAVANSNKTKGYVSKNIYKYQLDNKMNIIKTDTINAKAYLSINKSIINLEIIDLEGNKIHDESFQVLTKPSKQWETINGKSDFFKSSIIRSMDTKKEYIFKNLVKNYCYSFLIDRENKTELYIKSVNKVM